MKWSQEELEQLYQQVNTKAAQDEAFHKALLADPKAVLEQVAGRQLPDDLNLKIVENDGDFAATYIVPDFVQGELAAEELGEVSGGRGQPLRQIPFILYSCPLDGPCKAYNNPCLSDIGICQANANPCPENNG